MTPLPEEVLRGALPIPTYRDAPPAVAADIKGVDLSGSPAEVVVCRPGRWSVLVFLSSSCQGCAEIWPQLAEIGESVRAVLEDRPVALPRGGAPADAPEVVVVAVAKDPGDEDVAALSALVAPGATFVMSSAAWSHYRVGGAPFFSVVDGAARRVLTEGLPWGKDTVASAVRHATGDRR